LFGKKRHTKEARIRAIREHEAGRSQAEICWHLNITAPTFYRWKKQLGMMTNSDAQRLRTLEKDNKELKQMVADLLLEKRVLKIALEKNSKPAGPAGAPASRPRPDVLLGAPCLQDPRAASEHGTVSGEAA
jgi:putative transposase